MDNPNSGQPAQKPLNTLKNFFDQNPIQYIIAAFAAAFCAAGAVSLLTSSNKTFTELGYLTSLSKVAFITVLIVIFAGLVFISHILKDRRIIPASLLVFSVVYGAALAFFNPDNIYFNIGIALVLFLVVSWIMKGDKIGLQKISVSRRVMWIMAGAGALLFTAVVSVVCIARYQSYSAHNFDFGIFTQMFENMRTTGAPDTTVERNVLMSHFGVHFSPVYYLLLPFYFIVPRPETLLVLQAASVASGVFAVVLICRKLNLSKNMAVIFSFIYLFFPSLANGCLYDFHENKFLTVLLLWTVYFMISNRTKWMFVFAVLTLTVKEDAAIYVAALALYLLISRREYLKGVFLFLLSGFYFVFAVSMVSAFNVLGEGVMMGRLENFIPAGGSGFLAVVQTCFLNFGYVLSQVFTPEKFAFMLWMLLPLAFMPFMNRKKSILLLFIPMLVIDLMSNWQYQYDINYQYTFGVAALLVAMSVFAVQKMKRQNRQTAVVLSASLCFVMTFSLFVPRIEPLVSYNNATQATTKAYNDLIATIPKDAEITANGFYIPHMYDFKNLYMYPNYYDTAKKTEYLLVAAGDVTANKDNLKTFMDNDYSLISSAGNMQLYKRK